MRFRFRRPIALLTGMAAFMVIAACAGGEPPKGKERSLVVDTSFDLKTIDPARQFEFTGSFLDEQIYDTALESHHDKPVDNLCSYKMSHNQKVLTLTLKDKGSKFSDGSKVTADDIVFSYKRLQGINGNPSFFLDGVTVKKLDDKTVKLISKKPNPTLPYILPNHSLGIVNKDAVKDHNGGIGRSDKADKYLDKHSQGSGPYKIKSYDPSNKIVLTANPHYSGTKPKYSRVVVRNVKGETQKTNVQSGDSQFALDLSPDQIKDLDQSKVHVKSFPSDYSVYLYTTMDPKVNKTVAKPKFRRALRYSLNYTKLKALGGGGAKQLASIVPNGYVGATNPKRGPVTNRAKAKRLLKAAGYHGETITFNYASDQTVSGVSMSQMAQTIQSQLTKVGVKLKLKPAPDTTNLDNYRSGKQTLGLASWGADYKDPENYLVFAPGHDVAKRVRWKKGQSKHTDRLTAAALSAKSPKERDTRYKELYRSINQTGPFVALMQPSQSVVASSSVKQFVANPDHTLKLSAVK